MNNQRATLFISDLHLDPADPKTTEIFMYFLNNIANQSQALYILGDFFEVYIGDDDESSWLTSIKTALKNFTRSDIPVYFMHGNRDFLIGKKFFKETGVILIPDPSLININNKTILLMHGDSLCTLDKNHQRFRKITRCLFIQKLFLLLPLSIRQNVAKKLRYKSSSDNKNKSYKIMDVTESAVLNNLQQYQVSTIIHGHTHRPAIYANRIVLGAWHDAGNYLKISDEQCELINF